MRWYQHNPYNLRNTREKHKNQAVCLAIFYVCYQYLIIHKDISKGICHVSSMVAAISSNQKLLVAGLPNIHIGGYLLQPNRLFTLQWDFPQPHSHMSEVHSDLHCTVDKMPKGIHTFKMIEIVANTRYPIGLSWISHITITIHNKMVGGPPGQVLQSKRGSLKKKNKKKPISSLYPVMQALALHHCWWP